jgi:excisionase family DNA binding protein
MAETYITLKAMANRLGFSYNTVLEWCQSGRVPGAFQPFGAKGQWRVPAAAVEALKKRRPEGVD